MNSHAKGLKAEKLAEIALMLKGYRILARRFKTPAGEVDIVARRGQVLAFVEVKHRKSHDAAAESITAHNRARVRNATALYLQEHPQYTDMDIRFDAMVVTPGAWPRHIVQAWED